MVVEVRSITSRPVRRRGMKPLVTAIVADTSGVMEVTFFNQPWLVNRYKPGTRLLLHGKYKARNRFTVESHAPTQEGVGAEAGAVAHYPATEGLSSTQILELVRALPRRGPRGAGAAAGEIAGEGAAARTAPRPSIAAHFGDHERGRRRLAFDELLLLQIALLRRRAHAARGRARGRAEPTPET